MPTTQISKATLANIIGLAHAARTEKNPNRGVMGLQSTAKEQAFIAAVDALPDQEMAELLAIMWIGRRDGTHSAEDFDEAVADAKTTLDHAGSYMEEKQPIVEYLLEGRKLLGV